MPFQKGISGNPGGRPKGTAGLCTLIREETKDGRELVLNALKIVRGELPGAKPFDVLAAIKLLMEYAYGKPIDHSEDQAAVTWGALLDEIQQQRARTALMSSGNQIGIRE